MSQNDADPGSGNEKNRPAGPPAEQPTPSAEPTPGADQALGAEQTAPAAEPIADQKAASETHVAGRSFFRRRTLAVASAATAGALVLGLSFAAGAAVGRSGYSQETSATTAVPALLPNRYGYPGGAGGQQEEGRTSTQSTPVAASSDEIGGVVTIVSELDYGSGEAAGTGIVVSSDGRVLTNNHVIEGATSIEVTVESTGETYTASVVGYDAAEDVAVLQLDDASGLETAHLDPSEEITVGDAVTSVGNADGTGTLVAADGTVSGVDETITAGDAAGGDAEQLSDLIQIDADVVSGDSGGPLLDADGDVIGIVTAASSGSAVVTGYAIDIDQAIAVWEQIESGQETGTVHIGLPAFLGVLLSGNGFRTGSGALIGGVVDGSPAGVAGLTAGDTITAVDGVAVSSADELSSAIAAHEPGDSVEVSFTDAAGATQQATVTLAEGPAA